MKRTRHTPEQIITKLREAEAMEAAGASRAEVLQKLGVSEQTLLRWRKQFRGMGDDQIKRLKALEEENRRLKKAAADLAQPFGVLDAADLLEAIELVRRGCP